MQRKNFSLIELLIVVAIIGALTALILPQFDVSEAEAKDAGCDYSQYGTMRTLSQFRSINGVYPTGWHTGLESQTTTTDVMGTNEASAMADITWGNIDNNASIAVLTAAEVESLKLAGIGSLGYGYGIDAKAIATTTTAIKMSANWHEDASHTGSTGGTAANLVTFNGTPYTTDGDVTGLEDKYDSVVVLFAAPTVDWENYYTGGDLAAGQASKVGVAQEGKCPWVKDIFGYYIGFFGTKGTTAANAAKAKLVGTTCPECGPLNP